MDFNISGLGGGVTYPNYIDKDKRFTPFNGVINGSISYLNYKMKEGFDLNIHQLGLAVEKAVPSQITYQFNG